MSVNPCWIQRCKSCGAVVSFSGVRNGDESEVVRLAPGDDGYPPRLDALCVHLGGTYDPNQASLFDEAEASA